MEDKIKYKSYLNKIECIDNPDFNRREYIRLDKNESFYKYPKIF